MPSKSTFKYILPIFISLAAVFAYHYFLRASVPPKVSFTADTILSLSGLADGDLYIAQNSACDSFDVSGKNLTVSSIPDGSNFILKTAKHNNALRISSSDGSINLDFSSDNFLSGDITSWTISNSGSSAVADVIWGVPKANTRYLVKTNGVSFGSFSSDASSEITFRYNLLSSANFTLETDKGGSTFIKPQKPDVSKVIIAASENKILAIYNLPINVDQVAVSSQANFSNISWEKIVNFGITDKYQDTDKLYIKFRSKEGGVSDVVTWERNGADIQEGDIVKTKDSPDVYILKEIFVAAPEKVMSAVESIAAPP